MRPAYAPCPDSLILEVTHIHLPIRSPVVPAAVDVFLQLDAPAVEDVPQLCVPRGFVSHV
jgi:hypothetical protein